MQVHCFYSDLHNPKQMKQWEFKIPEDRTLAEIMLMCEIPGHKLVFILVKTS